jgi:hypothetical protein
MTEYVKCFRSGNEYLIELILTYSHVKNMIYLLVQT